ncbi:acyl-CoA-binding domain-containing protein 4 isoform X2 [Serinus canaria]|nr:acyl-CoA-binding domain-containing protein 4 isoform X2 [Serinus canaria]
MLRFYSYYKQATAGRCQGPRPGFWDPIGRYKWDAWHSLGAMSKEEAMAAYVAEMKKVAQKVIDTVPMDESTEEMFRYFEPLYEVIHDMPRPPESFFRSRGGECGRGARPCPALGTATGTGSRWSPRRHGVGTAHPRDTAGALLLLPRGSKGAPVSPCVTLVSLCVTEVSLCATVLCLCVTLESLCVTLLSLCVTHPRLSLHPALIEDLGSGPPCPPGRGQGSALGEALLPLGSSPAAGNIWTGRAAPAWREWRSRAGAMGLFGGVCVGESPSGPFQASAAVWGQEGLGAVLAWLGLVGRSEGSGRISSAAQGLQQSRCVTFVLGEPWQTDSLPGICPVPVTPRFQPKPNGIFGMPKPVVCKAAPPHGTRANPFKRQTWFPSEI